MIKPNKTNDYRPPRCKMLHFFVRTLPECRAKCYKKVSLFAVNSFTMRFNNNDYNRTLLVGGVGVVVSISFILCLGHLFTRVWCYFLTVYLFVVAFASVFVSIVIFRYFYICAANWSKMFLGVLIVRFSLSIIESTARVYTLRSSL